MAYITEMLQVKIRLRDSHMVGVGEIVQEHFEHIEGITDSVSLDRLYEAAHEFVAAVYLRDEFGMGLTQSDIPVAYAIEVNGSTFSQGADGGGVVVVLELLSDKAWDLWIGVFGAWLYDQLRPRDSDEG